MQDTLLWPGLGFSHGKSLLFRGGYTRLCISLIRMQTPSIRYLSLHVRNM